MSNKSWQAGIDPKLQGCWNLHNAIKGKDNDLDFFFMTSSGSGSIGQAAQANYCAANYALDMFARHRRSMGLPATAVGSGMISEIYILTGMESTDMDLFPAKSDLRTGRLLARLEQAASVPTSEENNGETPAEDANSNSKEATTARIRKKFAKLLSIQLEKVDTAKNLAAYGVDSMMGTEFRTWLFQTFKVYIPFFEFLDAGTTIESLSKKILSAA
ncbi:hypothetical protein OEA41_004155 [Lepraria neglecta]|uniref:Carrier domain-containing protein n=1 Tax=Lepraria neglecta TaxID=209136 RepID=A0AAD9Z6V8_9LECA|nr:hypothetical protein OEA41_004155 [Lepraria neglecta]